MWFLVNTQSHYLMLQKRSYAKISALKLFNAQGMMVPLSEVVRVEKVASSPTIMSKNLQKMVSIVAEADLVSQVYLVRGTLQNKRGV